jgi:radical SAM protein with 4Fe4S-binding SPASM domain
MKIAETKPNYDTKRTDLRIAAPLSSPFSVQIEPTRYCNFKCYFCMHSTRGTENDLLKKSGFTIKHMDSDIYTKFVDSVMNFDKQPKLINFCGIGEPLMNPNLGGMLRELRNAGYSGKIITYTNAAVFSPDKCDDLVDAGMDEFRISINGLTSEAFEKNCGIRLDMDKYVSNIKYLYEHRKNSKVYIKIFSNTFENQTDEKKFFDMFGGNADNIFVEHLVNSQQQYDYGEVLEEDISLFGEKIIKRDVCGCMFYQLHVDCDGNVFVCISLGKPAADSIGNVKDNSLPELWRGKKRTELLRINLKNGSDAISFCKDCGPKYDINTPEEILDGHREEILKRLEAQYVNSKTSQLD